VGAVDERLVRLRPIGGHRQEVIEMTTENRSGCGPYFQQLGHLVAERWSRRDNDVERFPEVACQALADLPPETMTPAQILTWAHQAPVLPQQVGLELGFGDLALCAFRAPRFYIEVLFWLNATTSIHQHCFSGAFHVLAGSSIHSQYRFQVDDRVNEHMLLGDVQFLDSELLRCGQTRPIVAGQQMIHALFHLDRPSVTLVVRTPGGPGEGGHQFNYHRPCLAIDPFDEDERRQLLRKSLRLLRGHDAEAWRSMLEQTAVDGDLHTLFQVLDDATQAGLPEDQLRSLLQRARSRHGERATRLEPVLREDARIREIGALRTPVVNPDHRFFLALLLNVPRGDRMCELVRAHFPERDPRAVILGWMEELSRLPGDGETLRNLVGITFGDAETAIVRGLLQGASPQRILDDLRAANFEVEGEEAMVEAFCQKLKQATMWRPLFA
jgi:hypothetical protein